MYKHIWRSLLNNKKYTSLNILGLGISLAACFFIFLWIFHQYSFDKFHDNFSRIYQINYKSTKDGQRWAGSPAPLAPAIEKSVTGIEEVARVRRLPEFAFKYKDNLFYESGGLTTDPAFFDIFSFKTLQGDPKQALDQEDHMVITESFAKKYFGDENPMDKEMFLEGEAGGFVKAVIEDVPANSHIQFDYLLSHKFAVKYELCGMYWGDPNFRTFILTTPGASIESLSKSIEKIARENHCPHIISGDNIYHLRNLKNIYLDHEITNRLGESGDYRTLFIFASIGIIILLLACINYINLSLSLINIRRTSSSIKKICGASRSNIFYSFLSETSIIVTISLLLALLIIEIFKSSFLQLAGQDISFEFKPIYFISLLVLLIITTILCGIYPSIKLSNTEAIALGKSTREKNRFMGIMIIFQNSISIALIICVLLFTKQLSFVHSKDLGFSNNQVAYITLRGKISNNVELLKEQMAKNPEVVQIALKDCVPYGAKNNTRGIMWKRNDQIFTGGDERVTTETTRIDVNYFNMLDVKFHQGRNFDDNLESDKENYIINQEAARKMGMVNPIGKEFALYGRWGTIVGVIKDTYFKNLHDKINPQVFYLFKDLNRESYFSSMFFKLRGKDISGFIKELQNTWTDLNPNIPFDYHFLDTDYETLYKKDLRLTKMIAVFTFLSIFIACLGLIGQSQISAEARTKEIGIRKVVGATIFNIFTMISKNYTQWILLANIIAWPIAYYAMSRWLENFAYRIDITIWPFVFAGLAALMIALITVSWQAIRAATANPVEALRYE